MLKNCKIVNEPFQHCVIENFLPDPDTIYDEFPPVDETWHKYCNPIEYKYAFDKYDLFPDNIKKLFDTFASKDFTSDLGNLFGIENLEPDPYLHGAGLHSHPVNGRLSMHLDYEKHPFMEKERRLNLILFLNKDWKEEYNGDLQLWNNDMTKCEKRIYPVFNRAVIFKTNDISWHGLPEKIKKQRLSIAYYWVSDIVSIKEKYRQKAKFVPRPFDVCDDRLKKLYDIRQYRRIEKEDMDSIFPEWNPDF